jgi:class 3 adenylate cyclase
MLDAVGRALADRSLDPAQRVSLALALIGASSRLDHATLYDASGRRIDRIVQAKAAFPPAAETLDPALLADARDGAAMGAAEAWEGEVRVPVVVPIRADDAITGFVASHVSLRHVQERVSVQARYRLGDRRDALFVIDDRLRVVAHPDVDVATALTSVEGKGIVAGLSGAALKNGVAKYGDYPDENGRSMVGTLAPLPRRPFAVVTQVAFEEAYAPVATMRQVVFAALAGAALLSLAAALAFARRLTAPIVKLVAFARELAARRFDRRVSVATRDELAVLGDAMSAAAAELQASEAQARREHAIRADLGRYLPAELVDKIVRREQDMALGGQRTAITVMFADVVGFTDMAEKLGAEPVVTMLNEMFTILTEIVFKHGGTVDKFMGDCLMALWGAPTPQADHAARAIAAAQDMLRWIEVGRQAWEVRYGVKVQLALGINSGEAIVGNIGSTSRMEYTAIGDVVNVAARLEAIARPQQVLVTRAVRDASGGGFEFIPCGERELTGRSGMVEMYEVRP